MAAPFEGIARKLVLPFIVLTAIGWLLVVIGFGIKTQSDNDRDDFDAPGPLFFNEPDFVMNNEPESYPYWIVTLSGPLTFIAAVVHAALWAPWSRFAGAVTSFLSVLFLTGLGMILYFNGDSIREVRQELEEDFDMDINIPEYFKLEFAGAVLATFFWTPVIILWHFYDGFWSAEETTDFGLKKK